MDGAYYIFWQNKLKIKRIEIKGQKNKLNKRVLKKMLMH